MFKKDQKVWCLIYGQGVVTDVDSKRTEETYPVYVGFQKDGELHISYTADGRFHNQGNVTLFPYPVEIVKATTKPSIDWDHVSKKFQYLAMDSGGLHYLFTEKPDPIIVGWTSPALYIYAEHFASFSAGTCHWRDSLVKRPN